MWPVSAETRSSKWIPKPGTILERYGPDRGVLGPDDLAFAHDGSIYFASILTGKVGHITPAGEVEYVAELTMGADPITFSDEDRLFVAQCFMDDKLYEIDPGGVEEPRLITDQLGPHCGLNGMDWGSDGYLYGPRWFNGEVVRVDVDSGEFTTVADGFRVPAALKFDTQGRLFVLDTAAGEVIMVDAATGEKEVFATLSPGLDNLAFDAEDRLYVSSFTDGSIVEVLTDGTTRTVSPPGLISPGGVTILAGLDGESLYIADFFGLREYDPQTGELKRLVPSVLGVSDLYMPTTVAADGEDLLLTSWPDNVVWTWDTETDTLMEEYRNVEMPLNAIRFGGDLLVAELGTGSVVRLDGMTPEDRITLVDGLVMPAGLAALDGALWVSDAATGQVLQIAQDGQILDEPITVAYDLVGPEGLAAIDHHNLLVVEAGAGRLSHIDLESGEVRALATDLALGLVSPTAVPTAFHNGVAVGQDGTIFVTGDLANVLYRIESPFITDVDVEDILGVWHVLGLDFDFYHKFYADGTFHIGVSSDSLDNEPLATGEFWFDDGNLVMVESEVIEIPPCGEEPAIYAPKLLDNGNLSLTVIDDDCEPRVDSTAREHEPVR